MVSAKTPYLIQISPVFGKRSLYIWTINGTQTLFHETSETSYGSVEQALAHAQARIAELA